MKTYDHRNNPLSQILQEKLEDDAIDEKLMELGLQPEPDAENKDANLRKSSVQDRQKHD